MTNSRMDDAEVARILHESRQYLESNGWVTDVNEDSRGRVCALGAVLLSQNWQNQDGDLDTEYYEEIRQVSLAVIQTVYSDVEQDYFALNDLTSWNDNVARSKQEVLDAFAKAEKVALTGFDPDAA